MTLLSLVTLLWPLLYAGKLARDAVRWVRRERAEELRALDLILTGACVRNNPEASREAVALALECMVEGERIRRRVWWR